MKKRVAIYNYNAIFSSLLKFYNNHEIAKKVTEIMKNDLGVEYDIYKTNSDGFVFRRRKDDSITTGDIMKILAKAAKELIKDNENDIIDYIQDNYDVVFDMDMINSDFSEELFDVSRNGRLITVEFDV